MSDLDNLIAAAKQGNLERVNAILEADNSLVNQKKRVRCHALTLCGAERP